MTLDAEFRAVADELTALFGATASVVYQGAAYNLDGSVTKTATTVSVTAAGPINESRRYAATNADTRVTGTFYVSASALTVRPSTGDRITQGGKTWQVIRSSAIVCNGADVVHQLDCGEVA